MEHGTKETKEAVIALLSVGAFVVKRAKDGVDLTDAVALIAKIQDPEFVSLVTAGVEGIEKVGEEFKDLKLAEAFQLAGDLIPEVVKAIESVK